MRIKVGLHVRDRRRCVVDYSVSIVNYTVYRKNINKVGIGGKQSKDTYTMEEKRAFYYKKYRDHTAIT
jgi:hypothetical protein